MIINHKYQFCFFQIPRTASTAIAHHLVGNYGSEHRDKKHSRYSAFYETASHVERNYLKIGGIRNPLDSLVSQYFKIKTDHNGRFYDKVINKKRNPVLGSEIHQFIKNNAANFEAFYKTFHSKLKIPLVRFEHTLDNMDFIIRYEHLQEDFKLLSQQLNMPIEPIPIINTTLERDKSFLKYYTPEIIPIVIEKYGCIMQKWGYNFPESWKDSKL